MTRIGCTRIGRWLRRRFMKMPMMMRASVPSYDVSVRLMTGMADNCNRLRGRHPCRVVRVMPAATHHAVKQHGNKGQQTGHLRKHAGSNRATPSPHRASIKQRPQNYRDFPDQVNGDSLARRRELCVLLLQTSRFCHISPKRRRVIQGNSSGCILGISLDRGRAPSTFCSRTVQSDLSSPDAVEIPRL